MSTTAGPSGGAMSAMSPQSTPVNHDFGASMNARIATLPVPPARSLDSDSGAHRRFGAIVRDLFAAARAARAPGPAARPPHADADGDEPLAPTRRINRVRRLLGRLPVVGKSRAHTRPR